MNKIVHFLLLLCCWNLLSVYVIIKIRALIWLITSAWVNSKGSFPLHDTTPIKLKLLLFDRFGLKSSEIFKPFELVIKKWSKYLTTFSLHNCPTTTMVSVLLVSCRAVEKLHNNLSQISIKELQNTSWVNVSNIEVQNRWSSSIFTNYVKC